MIMTNEAAITVEILDRLAKCASLCKHALQEKSKILALLVSNTFKQDFDLLFGNFFYDFGICSSKGEKKPASGRGLYIAH